MSGPFVYTNTTTFNLESVLRANILGSDYYNKTCLEMSTWEEVIDEIYECVEDVEPWMSGNARGPSTAFCLLHRLFTLKLNTKQVKDTINHRDSPYIRAIGLLFLRYVADPKTLLSWVGPFLADKEELAPSPGGDKVTMGDFVRDIILEQYYFETIFPRIPKPVMDNIVEELKRRGLPYKPKGNAGQGGPDRRGVDDGNKRPPSVKASLSVAFGQRAPNRAGAREDRYASAISHTGKSNTGAAPGPSTAHERVRERSPSNVYGSSRSSRDERDRERGRESRDRDRDRDRERERERDRERGRDYRDRDSDRGRDRDYRDRDYDRDRARDKERERAREKERSSSRRRSRSRSPRRSHRDERDSERGGRDARDVFREKTSVRDDASQAARAAYGDASGKLFDDRDRRRGDESLKGRNEEVYRVGGGRR